MPIYEYRRPDGSTFEVLQKFSDEALTQDPDTGVPVERVLSAPAIHFKGSGFHNTDYGTRKRPAAGGSEGSSSDASSTSSGDKGSSSSSSGSSDGGSSSGATSSSSASSSSGGAKD